MNPKLPENISQLEIDQLAKMLGLHTATAKDFLKIALENVILFDRKHEAYGPNNIRKGGTFGCVLRSSDKFERLFTMFENRRRKLVNESILDNFRDISNYQIIAVMLEKGLWPKQ